MVCELLSVFFARLAFRCLVCFCFLMMSGLECKVADPLPMATGPEASGITRAFSSTIVVALKTVGWGIEVLLDVCGHHMNRQGSPRRPPASPAVSLRIWNSKKSCCKRPLEIFSSKAITSALQNHTCCSWDLERYATSV